MAYCCVPGDVSCKKRESDPYLSSDPPTRRAWIENITMLDEYVDPYFQGATKRRVLLSYTNKLQTKKKFGRFEGNKTNMTLKQFCVYMETKAPSLLNAVPPYGHVIASEKWRNSPLIQSLKGGGVKVLFENELGVSDFHLPNKSCILYVSECDIIAGNSYKRKLVRYRNTSSSFQELVLVENTRLSEQYFSAVQKFVVFDLGLTLLPVSGQTEASQLISQIVHGEGRENPFKRRSSSRLLDPLVLALVQHVPGVGRVKALALLQQFSSIHQLCNATPHELEPIVGQAAAQQIHSFFHKPTAAGT